MVPGHAAPASQPEGVNSAYPVTRNYYNTVIIIIEFEQKNLGVSTKTLFNASIDLRFAYRVIVTIAFPK